MTEDRGEDGFLRAGIDFDKLKDILAPALAEGQETYEFRWVGKSKAMREAGQATTKTLRPDLDESVDFDQSENVFITGDNLEALKILQESYLGVIDMIYIDPPYNTGKDFVYKDNFHKTVAEQDEAEGNLDEEGNRLHKNEKTNPRYHSDWLNMIYPRLILARNLLKDSGVIFISIDDNEQANLKQVCDEVFGEGNFVASLIWTNKEGGGSSDSLNFRVKHENILVYSKNIDNITIQGVEISNEERYKLSDSHEPVRGKYYLQKMGMSSIQYSKSLDYGIETPDGNVIFPSDNNNGKKAVWRWSKEKLQWGIENDYIVIKKDSKGIWTVYSKQYLRADNNGNIIKRTQRPMGVIDDYSSTQASKYMDKLGLGNYFSYSKPVSLVKYLIERASLNLDTIILDFFAGSATTADAVMQLNAEDGGKRKYILCTLDEEVADKSAAQQAGYTTIDQISRERIRRAADKIRKEQPDKAKDLDLGFRAFRVDESNFRDVSKAPSEFVQGNMFESVDNIREDATALDLLFQVMIAWGSRLSLKISEQKLGDNTIYSVDEGSFIACFDDRITEETIRAIAQQKPQRAVFKDTSFTHSADKINLTQIFKEVSPETQVKVV
ncbi:site-specific DNA-methyltransferase [Streptococcus hyointestinalis]|uniref:site-specific DNA-methyltransferase n=1 Tax=Streptococcus hyointestinalis TaxID=1337 RepID=UPI003D046211